MHALCETGLGRVGIVCLLLSVGMAAQQPAGGGVDMRSPQARAGVAAADVQRLYDPETGLFCPDKGGDCWWWSANELIAVIDYDRKIGSKDALGDIETTYAQAGSRGPGKGTLGPFVDTWNDDNGWWGLAWVDAYDYARVYDPPHAARYLARADGIFNYMVGQWDPKSCGGGLWQYQKPAATKNAITNEVFLALAAKLALRADKPIYLEWALREWKWFDASGMIDAHHLIATHVELPKAGQTGRCEPIPGANWTLRQGEILGALTDLYEVTKDSDPALAKDALRQAIAVADCETSRSCAGNPAISNPPIVDERGILSEPCGRKPCTGSSYQYKGVFVRNLSQLQGITGKYGAFLAANAQSVWNDDRNGENLFGFTWDAAPGGFFLPGDGKAPVEGAALMLLTTQIP